MNKNKTRIEAFSDGFFAIIIIVMVLELKTSHGPSLADFIPLKSIFLCYLLSFIYWAIYSGLNFK